MITMSSIIESLHQSLSLPLSSQKMLLHFCLIRYSFKSNRFSTPDHLLVMGIQQAPYAQIDLRGLIGSLFIGLGLIIISDHSSWTEIEILYLWISPKDLTVRNSDHLRCLAIQCHYR